jgi:hypothetical protein
MVTPLCKVQQHARSYKADLGTRCSFGLAETSIVATAGYP